MAEKTLPSGHDGDDDDEIFKLHPEDLADDRAPNEHDDEDIETGLANEDPFGTAPTGAQNGPAGRLLGAIHAAGGFEDGEREAQKAEQRPGNYNFYGYETPSEHPVFRVLERWVRWLVWHFELGDAVPPCWADHDAIAEEMIALYRAWEGSYNAPPKDGQPTDQLTWLGLLDASLTRISTKWDRANCGSRGQHDTETSLRSVWPDMAEAGGPHPDAEREAAGAGDHSAN